MHRVHRSGGARPARSRPAFARCRSAGTWCLKSRSAASGTHSPGDGNRSSSKARRIRSQPSATFKRRSWRIVSSESGASASSAIAEVTSRSTSVIIAASSSWRSRAHRWIIDAVFRSASGRDMPAIARESSEAAGGSITTFTCQAPERLLNSQKPRVQLALEQHERVSRRQQELHAGINRQSERSRTTRSRGRTRPALPGRRENIRKDHDRAAGRPMAEPTAPIVRTRLRKRPPKRNSD